MTAVFHFCSAAGSGDPRSKQNQLNQYQLKTDIVQLNEPT